MKELNGERMAVYSRKSRFTGKGESIENQIGLCRQYIRLHFGEKSAEECLVYEDEGFSGKNLDRPMFRQMMQDGKAGKFSAIVVYRLDRISRNIGDFAGLIESLSDRNIAFISIKEQFDTSSPMGRAMMYIASVFSQLERETIAERIRDNMHELARTGRWLGGTTPVGYESEAVHCITVDGRAKKSCRLKLIPSEAGTVSQIYEKFLTTHSLSDTEEYLKEQGYRTRKGNPFTRFAVRGILTNPVYMKADQTAYDYLTGQGADLSGEKSMYNGKTGLMVYNRTLQKTGKAHELRAVTDWIAAPGAHRALISGNDWVRVQELLSENRKKGSRKSGDNRSLLQGLLFCGGCGAGMRSKLRTRHDALGERRFSYVCTNREKNGKEVCRMENFYGNDLDLAVAESLAALSCDDRTFKSRLIRSRRLFKGGKESEERLSGQDMEEVFLYLLSFPALFADRETEWKRKNIKYIINRVIWDGTNAHIYFNC